MTPDEFKWSKFKLGPFAKYFYVASAFFMAIVLAAQVSPFYFPVTAGTFNFVSPSKHSSFPRRYVDLIFSVQLIGRSDPGRNHHLRSLKLGTHPRG